MHDRVQDGSERRAAARHRVPGSAEVFWGGGPGTRLRISDVSASGCLLRGEGLPEVGTRVVIALALGDLPNVRMSGMVVRNGPLAGSSSGAVGSDLAPADPRDTEAAVRFLLPARCMPGMSRLLETEAKQHIA